MTLTHYYPLDQKLIADHAERQKVIDIVIRFRHTAGTTTSTLHYVECIALTNLPITPNIEYCDLDHSLSNRLQSEWTSNSTQFFLKITRHHFTKVNANWKTELGSQVNPINIFDQKIWCDMNRNAYSGSGTTHMRSERFALVGGEIR